jgi:O-6-methylguanine DNA methyltransferase
MVQPYDPEFRAWIDSLVGYLSDDVPKPDLPLDIRATAFQMRVWSYLAHIPSGEVRSYGEVAAAIGEPAAARAVAQACARNPAACIPCHRVIRGSGRLGGYRWGLGRKRALIERTRAASTNAARMSDFDLVVVGTGSSRERRRTALCEPGGESPSSTRSLTVERARCAVAIRRKCSSARPKSSIG